MTRSAFVLALLLAVSQVPAQVPPPLSPGEIARLRAVNAWDIDYTYHESDTRSGGGSLPLSGGYGFAGKSIDSWILDYLWSLDFTLTGTIAGKFGQSDCEIGSDSCVVKYTYPAALSGISEQLNRFEEAHFPSCCPDGQGGFTAGTQSIRSTLDITGSKPLDGSGQNWIRGRLTIDYGVNPPIAEAYFRSPSIGGPGVTAYAGWYRSDTSSSAGGSDYFTDLAPYDSVMTRVAIENGRFVIRGSYTYTNDYVPCPSAWLQCDSNTRQGTGAYVYTQEWVLTSHPDSSITVTRPFVGDHLVSGERDTIRWITNTGDSLRILYSLDSGMTFTEIADSVPAPAGRYAWRVPDTLSRKAVVRIESMADTSNNGLSGVFRMKPYVLTWNTTSGDYHAYTPSLDAWGFENTAADMWPASWYARFNYQGTDPFTGGQYSSLQGGGVFRNAVSSVHPDWVSFVNTFSENACYISTGLGIYSPTAIAQWAASADAWGGSCFGIAISNAIVFRDWGTFFGRYPDFTSFAVPAFLGSDTTVIPVVNELFTHQFGNPHLAIRISSGLLKTPNQTLNEMKAMFAAEDAPVRTLSILNNGPGGGGHAILAWGLRQDTAQPNLYYVSVYDNSWADSTNATIVVDTALNGGNGGWSYSLWPGWGGPKWMYLRDPAVNYLSHATFPKIDPGRGRSPFILEANELRVVQKGAGSIEIRDSIGNLTGFVDSLVRAEIPGSYPLVVENGSERPPYGYGLTLAPVSVSLAGISGGGGGGGGGGDSSGGATAWFFNDNRTFVAAGAGAQPSDTDRYVFDGGLSAYNDGAGAKAFDLMMIVNESALERTFSLDSVTFAQGDSLRMEIAGANGLKLTSRAGSAKSYDLEVELYADTGLGRFVAAGVPVGPGVVSHTIEPDWNDLAGSVLTILVDEGDDGTIEDTLGLSNELTGVEDGGLRNVPARYALHRNYPNPFNPSTKLSFEVPGAVRVLLTVHDVLGREVARLVDGIKGPGRHEVTFDAGALPGGVYFYTLRAGEFYGVEKMVLMK